MKDPIALGIAMLATASFALAGGGEGDEKNTRTMEKLGKSSRQDSSVDAAAGEGFTITAGEEFSLNVHNRVRVLWRFSNLDGATDTNNFSINQARTRMSGHLYEEHFTYGVSLEWTGGIIRDAWFNWRFWTDEDSNSQVGLRAGAQKPGFGKEATGTAGYLEHTVRGAASRTFASGNRVLGAFLRGSHLEGDKLHWHVGVANGDVAGAGTSLEAGNNAANPDNEVDFYFGARFDPMGDMGDEWFSHGDLEGSEEIRASVGAGLQVGNHRVAAAAPDVETLAVNVNGVVQGYGFEGFAEFFWREDDLDGGTESGHNGWFVGGSYTLPPATEGGTQWAGALRYGMVTNIDPTVAGGLIANGLGGAEGQIDELQATVSAYYKKHKLKTQVGYVFQNVDPELAADADNHFFDILFQWWF